MMNHKVTIELPENVYLPLAEAATRRGSMVEDVIVDRLRAVSPLPQALSNDETVEREGLAELMKFAGIIRSPHPNGANNDLIDEELAMEYGSSHEPE